MGDGSLTGRLLVATPLLGDPNFERTVVLILSHDADEGAFGVVLNRPSQTEVLELLPDWSSTAAEPSLMFLGGPVGPSGVVGVAVVAPGSADGADGGGSAERGWQPVVDRIGTVDLNQRPEEIDVPLTGVRLFAGSAGWITGQLEGEIEEGAWWVVDADQADVLSRTPRELWRDVLRRQPAPVCWFAAFPPDPLVN